MLNSTLETPRAAWLRANYLCLKQVMAGAVVRANILNRRRFAMAAAALPLTVSFWPRTASSQAAAALPAAVLDVYVAESVPVDVTAGSVGEARLPPHP
jgi:hypothetical protein